MPKLSAGLLVYTLDAGSPRVLLVHPGGPFWAGRDAGAWSIPKGEYARGEVPLDAAVREFREEIGTSPPPDPSPASLGEVVQAGGKRVRAWAVRGEVDVQTVSSNTFTTEWPPGSGHTEEFPEVDRAAWFDLDAARRKLVPAQAAFIDRLAAMLAGTSRGVSPPERPRSPDHRGHGSR